jgi:hypothetical protein
MKSRIHEYIDLKHNLMNRNFWYIVPLAAVFFFSCRKKEFPATVPAPESDFYFNGIIEGRSVSLKAGVDGYYMYSSHARDQNSLYRFIGDLKPANCSNCKNGLQVTIHDFRYTSPNESAKIDSLLPGSYPIIGSPYYAVQFRSHFNQPALSYVWDFGDNTTSTEAHPLHVYKTIGNYSVSLKINSEYECQQYISNIEKIRYPLARPKISVVNNSADNMSFSADIPDSASYSFHWNFGDGESSTSLQPSHTYKIAGTYPVSLRVIGPQQDTVYARYNVATQTSPMPCLTNYSITSVTRVVNPLLFSKVIVSWTDENGDVYTSNDFSQAEDSYFKIISVEEYDLNEKGEKTKKIKARFSCQVYNGTRVKTIKDAEAVLSVSYR